MVTHEGGDLGSGDTSAGGCFNGIKFTSASQINTRTVSRITNPLKL